MNRTSRLLFPALRWSPETGFDHERARIDEALHIGVGGFTIFGGTTSGVAHLTAELRERSAVPLLIGSDLERGAGQQFPQATPLPPLAALGAVDDVAVTRRAGELTACEALAVGVSWVFAPVADVDLEPKNPIVGTRSFGTDPDRVAAHVAAWITGAQSIGVLCCAKHFPGHGRTTTDSHETLPRVRASRGELERDLAPFRAAIGAGVESIMTAHVVYEAFDDAMPATLSRRILHDLLREELDYDGLVVSDAMNMAGVRQAAGGSEARAAIAALNAGCDALLYPSDLGAMAAALESALGAELDAHHVARSIRRVDTAARQPRPRNEAACGTLHDSEWSESIAERAVFALTGAPRLDVADEIELVTIDDDLGGPFAAPSRGVFADALRDAGVPVRPVERPGGAARCVIAVYCDIRAWKNRPGLSAESAAAVRAALDADPDATVVWFAHPRLAAGLPARHLLAAWGGERLMQRAAAHWLTRGP